MLTESEPWLVDKPREAAAEVSCFVVEWDGVVLTVVGSHADSPSGLEVLDVSWEYASMLLVVMCICSCVVFLWAVA